MLLPCLPSYCLQTSAHTKDKSERPYCMGRCILYADATSAEPLKLADMMGDSISCSSDSRNVPQQSLGEAPSPPSPPCASTAGCLGFRWEARCRLQASRGCRQGWVFPHKESQRMASRASRAPRALRCSAGTSGASVSSLLPCSLLFSPLFLFLLFFFPWALKPFDPLRCRACFVYTNNIRICPSSAS